MSKIRLWLKDLCCRLGLGDRLIEYCEVCGVRQPVYWWSDNALWSAVTGEQEVSGDNMPGILCPYCFDDRAEAKGIFLKWMPTVDVRPAAGEGE